MCQCNISWDSYHRPTLCDDIVLMETCRSNVDKQLIILTYFFSNMGMTLNTNKIQIIIIKSRKENYANLI